MNNSLVLLPILIPLTGAPVALLLRRHPKVQAGWALGVMLTALACSLLLLAQVWRGGQPVVFEVGGWQAPFGIVLVGDMLSATMAFMAQLVLVMGVVYAMGSKDKVVGYPTFYVLFLTLATGLTGAMLTGDLFNLFVFAELLVFSGAILTANSDDPYGAEAALKYFYMSLLASASLLLGQRRALCVLRHVEHGRSVGAHCGRPGSAAAGGGNRVLVGDVYDQERGLSFPLLAA